MPTINLRRGSDSAALRRMRIEVDGETVARLRCNASEAVDVPVGVHTLRARMDWTRSEPLQVTLSDGDSVAVETAITWRAFTGMITNPSTALDLKFVD